MDTPAAPEAFRLARVSRARTVRRDKRPRWAELAAQAAFVVLMILCLSGPWAAGEADPALAQLRQIGYLAVLATTIVALRPWRNPQALLVVPWPLLLSLGWCWFSLSWALYPGAGLRRLVLTTIVAWSLLALVREIAVSRLLNILHVLLALLLVANYFAVFLFPATGLDPDVYEGVTNTWRGVMGQKNFVGFACAMTAIVFTIGAGFPAWNTPQGRPLLIVRIVVVLAAVNFLIQSQSKTSMGIGVFAILVGALFTYLATVKGQRRLAAPGWAWIAIVPFAIVCLGMAIDATPYLEMVSDPAAFTGRTQIWTGLIKAYVDQPLLGVGYGSLWDVGPDGPMKMYAEKWAGEVSQGHNGYLDMLVQVGAIGLLLILFATLVWPLQRLLRGGDHPARVLGAAMLFFSLGHNFTESSLFDRDLQGQVFLMIAIALLWKTTAAVAGDTRRPA
ncbi:O-antigen ligase [Sphingomonas sp. TZW2008]|uniref:O-antigen ligase family protein n=1 Tax=Sphingomonas sp. TZW2008 TaxID=1917973 RepID=UPI001181ABB4|nr:O-antigen ligase family protein [Sphingomonas sp. TZW2008]